MKYSSLLMLFIITGCYSHIPNLGDERSEVEETVHFASENFKAYESRSRGNDSAVSVTMQGDTLVYNIIVDDVKYSYGFSDGKCVNINMKFACLSCLKRSYRKWLFRGKWRINEAGYLLRRKDPAIAIIKKVEDCPYLYEVNIMQTDTALQKEDFKKLEKVDKRLIGTRKYMMKGS